ncbi:hypothetical protein L917_12409 [Phytophthora nicotianae]|uniref:Uncharacterized protein n=1 Tax=Phytophthora nicotianae TaxID=4792 RepID=W2KTL1_PHYNI|nr:hypothetical protein L917_12409 [Phytophthora nicotianae]
MLPLGDSTNDKKVPTIIYEDMENGDYGTFLGQMDRPKTTTASQYTYRKWLILTILSVLTAINQGICYSYAPIASIVEKRWEERVSLSLERFCPRTLRNESSQTTEAYPFP